MKDRFLPIAQHDPTLTTRDAARLLGISVSTAQKWIESGALLSWKTPGGHRRMRQSAVMALLDERMALCVDPLHALSAEFLPMSEADYPVPADEAARLRSVARTGLVNTPPDPAFDRITWLACRVTDAQAAVISLLTADRQWFKSRQGTPMRETARSLAFCSHAILGSELMVVEDARRDERLRDNALVTGDPHIRFYAGQPLRAPDGHALGTLCVFGDRPRTLDATQRNGMRALAALAEDEIRLFMLDQGRRLT